MPTFVIQKTSHASNATTPLMVLLGMVSLSGTTPGHQMLISPVFWNPDRNCIPTNASTLCAYNEDQTQGAYWIGMEWTKSWARNCQALWQQWVKSSYFTTSSKPRAWSTPRLHDFEYINGPLSLHCVHDLSLPWIRTAASLLNSSIPISFTEPSGYTWLCSTP